MECEPAPINASSFADSVSPSGSSFALIVSRNGRRLRARPVSNASRYMYITYTTQDDAPVVRAFLNILNPAAE